MKLVLYDQDVKFAANVAKFFKALAEKRGFFNGKMEVSYVESISEIGDADLVIADPVPEQTAAWLAKFRTVQGGTKLIVATSQPDIIRGCASDPCFAISKPVLPNDLLGAVQAAISGKWEDEKPQA